MCQVQLLDTTDFTKNLSARWSCTHWHENFGTGRERTTPSPVATACTYSLAISYEKKPGNVCLAWNSLPPIGSYVGHNTKKKRVQVMAATPLCAQQPQLTQKWCMVVLSKNKTSGVQNFRGVLSQVASASDHTLSLPSRLGLSYIHRYIALKPTSPQWQLAARQPRFEPNTHTTPQMIPH